MLSTFFLLFLADIGIIFALLFFLRKRHRYLFGLIVENKLAVDRAINDLSAKIDKGLSKLEFLVAHPGFSSSLPLEFPSQNGEDAFLFHYFKGKRQGFFVEAGAYDGVTFSNTYSLESIGWRGLLVEAHPELYEKCRRNRPNSMVIHAALGADDAAGEVEFTCADGGEDRGLLSFVKADDQHNARCLKEGIYFRRIRVPYTSLNELLRNRTNKVDVLSLDIEGMELTALHGFDIEKYQPDVILIESNDVGDGQQIAVFLSGFDYFHTCTRGNNSLYVKKYADQVAHEE